MSNSQIVAPRGADLLLSYIFPNETNLTGFSSVFTVYNAMNGTALLTVNATPNAHGSSTGVANVDSDPTKPAVTLDVKAADINALPTNAGDATQPSVLWFDLIVTTGAGTVQKLHGGPFVVLPYGAKWSPSSGFLSVDLDGVLVPVNIMSTGFDSAGTLEKITELVNAFAAGSGPYVRYDLAQGLGASLQAQARSNIGAVGPDNLSYGLALFTQFSSLSVGNTVNSIVTSGFSVAGKGGAKYIRTSAPSVTEQAAGTGRWLAQDANANWWRLGEDYPTQYMFGVIGDATVTYAANAMTVTGTDDTAAIQAAFDYVAYFSKTRVLRWSGCLTKITNTVYLGHGNQYVSWLILGDSQFAFNANGGYLSGIVPTFADRMAVNIAGARNCVWDGVPVIGLNHGWINANYNGLADRTSRPSWYGPQITTGLNSTYAPYAGIAVDGYAGVRQGLSSYPNKVYPAWTGIVTQYGEGTSSQVSFRRASIKGFEVGVAIQPNLMNAGSNGDFMRFDECDFSNNIHCASISSSDARNVVFKDCTLAFAWASIDNISFGSKSGNLNAIFDNCNFDNTVRWVNVDLGIVVQNLAPSVTFLNCYAEACWSIGITDGLNLGGRRSGIQFIGCQINFFQVSANEYSPVWYLDAGGPQVPVYFEDCEFSGHMGILAINGRVSTRGCSFPTLNQKVYDQATSGGRRAESFLCNIFAPAYDSVQHTPFNFFEFGSAAAANTLKQSDGYEFSGSNTGLPIPDFVRSLSFNGFRASIARAPRQGLDRGAYNLSAVSLANGIEWTFTASIDFMAGPDQPGFAVGVGDIVQDGNGGVLFYVKSAAFTGSGAGVGNTMTVTMRQITSVHYNAGVWSTAYNLVTNAGALNFWCARRVYVGLNRRIFMTATSASGNITLAAVGPENVPAGELGAGGGALVPPVAVNDYLCVNSANANSLEESVFPQGKVTAFNAATGAMTLDQNARRAGNFYVPLFVKV